MKKLLSLLAIICSLGANAQTIIVSFAGTGESFSVGSVLVENLTAATSTTITSGKLLRLNVLTDISPVENKQLSELKIYPNPMTDNAVIQVKPPVAGMATITVSDLNGKQIAQSRSYLENYLQEFCVSGIKSGLYIVTVKGRTFQYSGKLLSEGKSTGGIKINKVSSKLMATAEEKSTKGSRSEPGYVDMDFTTGDRLKFTGVSGNYSTVITDIPVSDKTITFNFITCKDGEDNSYPVVQIGTQLWMAENLKTSKYSNGESIETTTPADLNINVESTPKYQWAYEGVGANVAVYGILYTWYAVADSRNVCPAGWHVPTDIEFTTLEDYLIASGYNYDGTTTGNKIAKALASTFLWESSTGTGTIGNTDYPSKRNATGFSALPGGERTPGGGFNVLGSIGYLWTATEHEATGADEVFFGWCSADLGIFGYKDKKWGHSVRCLKD